MVVVAGAHIDAVRAAMPRARIAARASSNIPGWEQGQLSSLLAGLDAIDDPLLEAAVVTLVDVPLVRSSTVAEVIAAWRRTRAPIVRPGRRRHRHGHPVIFDRSIFADLRSADPDTGAKAVFAIHRDRIFNVEVKDAGAFEDIDTPADYEVRIPERTQDPEAQSQVLSRADRLNALASDLLQHLRRRVAMVATVQAIAQVLEHPHHGALVVDEG